MGKGYKMRKILAIFVSVLFAFLGFFAGAFLADAFFKGNNTLALIGGILGMLLFGFGMYYYRKDKEKCKKCGEFWSVQYSHSETLSQSTVSETMKTGMGVDTDKWLKTKNGDPTRYGTKEYYTTTNYLVGQEKLIYRCKKCGNETSKTKNFKRKV